MGIDEITNRIYYKFAVEKSTKKILKNLSGIVQKTHIHTEKKRENKPGQAAKASKHFDLMCYRRSGQAKEHERARK